MSKRLQNKVALITGGASGIGAAHARIFAEAGARLLVCDVQEDMGRGVVDEINRKGAKRSSSGLTWPTKPIGRRPWPRSSSVLAG